MSRPTRKNNILDTDQTKHAAQDNPNRHFSPPVTFLFQESILYTSIPLKRNVSARITLRGLGRLIWVDNVGFIVERLICVWCIHQDVWLWPIVRFTSALGLHWCLFCTDSSTNVNTPWSMSVTPSFLVNNINNQSTESADGLGVAGRFEK